MFIDKFGAFHYTLTNKTFENKSGELCNCISFPFIHVAFIEHIAMWYFESTLHHKEIILCTKL